MFVWIKPVQEIKNILILLKRVILPGLIRRINGFRSSLVRRQNAQWPDQPVLLALRVEHTPVIGTCDHSVFIQNRRTDGNYRHGIIQAAAMPCVLKNQ